MEDPQVEPVLTGAASDFAFRTADIPDTLGTVASGPDGAVLDPAASPVPTGGALTPTAIKVTLEQLFRLIAESGKGRDFWLLQSEEAQSLADVWHPILAPIWERWLSQTDGNLLPALMVTAMSLGPRVVREVSSRVGQTGSTATAKSGASQPFSDLPAAGNQPRPTDSSLMPSVS